MPNATTPAGTASLSGHAYRDVDGDLRYTAGKDVPLTGVDVLLTLPDGTADRATTPGDGSFAFAGLPAGPYRLTALAAGRTAAYPPGGLYAPTLADGMVVTEVDFAFSTLAATTPAAPPLAATPTPAPPAATPVPPPAVTLGGIVCGYGSAASARATYAVESPGYAHLSSIALTPTLNGYTRVWTLGDQPDVQPDPRHAVAPARFTSPTVDRNVACDVELVKVRFTTPGSYTVRLAITCTATGVTTYYAQAITVTANGRKPFYVGPNGSDEADGLTPATAWRTWAKARAIFAAPRAFLNALAGWSDTAVSDTRLNPDAVLLGQADAAGNPPTLYLHGCAAFSGWDGETDGALIDGMAFTADPATLKVDVVNGVTTHYGQGTKVVSGRGDGIVFANCRLGTLDYGFLIESGDGFGLDRCSQADPRSIRYQAVMDLSAGTLVLIDCTFVGSNRESTLRLETGRKSVAVIRGTVGMLSGDNGKAEETDRVGFRVAHWGVTFPGGTDRSQVRASTTAGAGSAGNVTADVLFACALGGSSFNVTATVSLLGILNCYINAPAGTPEVTLTPPGVTAVTIVGNTGTAGPIRVKVSAPMVGLITDALVTGAGGKVIRAAGAVAAAVAFVA